MAYAGITSTLFLLPGIPQTSTSAGYTRMLELIQRHLDRSDNIINSKIARRYDISGFTESPLILSTICQDIASYFIFRSEYGSDNQNINEWTDKFNDAMTLLDEIRDGDIDLVDSDGNLIEERVESDIDLVESNTMNYQSFFDEDDSTNWKIDSDKADSISDNR